MRGKSCGFFGLSTGSLPPGFTPRIWVPPAEPVSRLRAAPPQRSAGLTAQERALLDKHLGFYLALAHGSRRPDTEAQHHFVAVCRGEAQPVTLHEVAFVKWQALRATRQR
jgi:hypothetical protein